MTSPNVVAGAPARYAAPMSRRYALYYTPPPGPFAEAGAAWLTRDEAARPRRYGFHATLNAPFHLADGRSESDLHAALQAFGAQTPRAQIAGLEVTRLGRILALTPSGTATPLTALAANIVETFAPFRAPLSAAEMARRRGRGLSPDAEARLQRWGYPHVMDGFRFHMTLTGPLPKDSLARVTEQARVRFVPCLPRPFTVDAVTLCREDSAGTFEALSRIPLAKTPD